jgi:hypothetical protein
MKKRLALPIVLSTLTPPATTAFTHDNYTIGSYEGLSCEVIADNLKLAGKNAIFCEEYIRGELTGKNKCHDNIYTGEPWDKGIQITSCSSSKNKNKLFKKSKKKSFNWEQYPKISETQLKKLKQSYQPYFSITEKEIPGWSHFEKFSQIDCTNTNTSCLTYLIEQAKEKHLNPNYFLGLIAHESAFYPHNYYSGDLPSNASGLCMFQPGTFKELGYNWRKVFDPKTNIDACIEYTLKGLNKIKNTYSNNVDLREKLLLNHHNGSPEPDFISTNDRKFLIQVGTNIQILDKKTRK